MYRLCLALALCGRVSASFNQNPGLGTPTAPLSLPVSFESTAAATCRATAIGSPTPSATQIVNGGDFFTGDPVTGTGVVTGNITSLAAATAYKVYCATDDGGNWRNAGSKWTLAWETITSDGTETKPYCSYSGPCEWGEAMQQKCATGLCVASGYTHGVFVSAANNPCDTSFADDGMHFDMNGDITQVVAGPSNFEAQITADCSNYEQTECLDTPGVIANNEGSKKCKSLSVNAIECNKTLAEWGATLPGGADYGTDVTYAQLCPASLQSSCSINCASSKLPALSWEPGCQIGDSYYDLCATLEFCIRDTDKYGYKVGGECTFPGPTIRMTPGKRHLLTLFNDHTANATNLHTHGLHVPGEGNSDDVTRKVFQGNRLHYVYDLLPDEMGGTFWYHSHMHELVYEQVGKGAFGLLVIDDNLDQLIPQDLVGRANVAAFLDPANEVHLYISYTDDTVYVNGEINPTITLAGHAWYRMRIAVANKQGTEQPLKFPDDCEVRVIAHDGVYSSSFPSRVLVNNTNMRLTGATRTDVAIKCTGNGDIIYGGFGGSMGLPETTAASIAIGPTSVDDLARTPFSGAGADEFWVPNRPKHYQDLRGSIVPEKSLCVRVFEDSTSLLERLGGQTCGNTAIADQGASTRSWDPATPNMELELGKVYEMEVYSTLLHPMHLHVNHFQVVQVGGCRGGHADFFYEEGEFYDSVAPEGPCLVRFNASIPGRQAYHCHVLEHSDKGAVGWINIVGGTIQTDQDPGKAEYSSGECTYDTSSAGGTDTGSCDTSGTLAEGDSCTAECNADTHTGTDVTRSCDWQKVYSAGCTPKPCNVTFSTGLIAGDGPEPCVEGIGVLASGEKCAVKCDQSNYDIQDATLTCLEGALSGLPTCVPKGCAAPTIPAGQATGCGSSVAHDASCTVTSNPGYSCTGPGLCQFGGFAQTVACAPLQCDTLATDASNTGANKGSSDWSPTTTVDDGFDTAAAITPELLQSSDDGFACDTGYQIDTAVTLLCSTADGAATFSGPICKPFECDTLAADASNTGATHGSTGWSPASTVDGGFDSGASISLDLLQSSDTGFTCDAGFEVDTAVTLLCPAESGAATFSGPICKANPCTPTQVANSNKWVAGSLTGAVGESVTVTCDEGFTGSGEAVCGDDFTFSIVTCTEITVAPTAIPTTTGAPAPSPATSGPVNKDELVSIECQFVLQFSSQKDALLNVLVDEIEKVAGDNGIADDLITRVDKSVDAQQIATITIVFDATVTRAEVDPVKDALDDHFDQQANGLALPGEAQIIEFSSEVKMTTLAEESSEPEDTPASIALWSVLLMIPTLLLHSITSP